MKKKNILFVLFIVFGLPFLFLALLIGGGIYMFSVWRQSEPPVVTIIKKVQPAPPLVAGVDKYNVAALNFTDFSEHLDLSKNTSMHVSYFWDNVKGKRVKWTGKVVDVKGGNGKAEITVVNSDDPDFKDFNIVLTSYKPDQAAALKKDEYITFYGDLCTYKGAGKQPIIVYLDNAEIIH
jgi:hypothetical protein